MPRQQAKAGLWKENELTELRRNNKLLHQVAADYDRRMTKRRGRFLLWLIRKVT